MKKIYLASRYSRHNEMQGVRDVLESFFNLKVTSRWIDLHTKTKGRVGERGVSFSPEELSSQTEACSDYAIADIEDIQSADTVISFTCGSGGKGGRHVEFGYGLALGKSMVVVGPRENVFHTLPQVSHFVDWTHFVTHLTKEFEV